MGLVTNPSGSNPSGFDLSRNPLFAQQRANPFDNFVQETIRRFNENAAQIIGASIDAVAQTGTTVPSGTPISVPAGATSARGQNYEVSLGRLDDRPVLVFRGANSDVRVVPVERFIDIREWFAPGVRAAQDRQHSQQQLPQQPQQQQQQQQHQQQQPSMNLFEYMSKLPPQERMVFTVLLYLLISETLGRVFQRGGGRQQPPIAYMQSPWMPGPPKGQQWMIWG